MPNYESGSLTPVDLWNERTYPAVEVGPNPSGAVVLPGDVDVAVAVRGVDRVAFVNTASHRIVETLEEGIGASPFSVVVAPGGRLAFVGNTRSHDVSVIDLGERRALTRITVGEIPIAMAVRPDGSELWVSCEGSHEVRVIGIPAEWRARPREAAARPVGPTPVAVLGMIHGTHRESERWGLEELRQTIRRLAPEVVLTEIPPDRWDRIWTDWRERSVVEDDRLQLFPEYTDVLLPLADELGFEIVPCAAWTREMADLRRARIASFQTEAMHAEARRRYEAAEARLEEDRLDGEEDDPLVIHSPAYDEWTWRRLAPYDEFLNEHIGPGGWTHINRAHMALLDAALDRRPGKRVLVTFGAGHKYWFQDRLRERADVELVDVTPYLPTGSEAVEDAAQSKIAELHQFFEDWFAGRLSDTDAAFARCAGVLAEGFEIVGPDGKRTQREPLLAGLRSSHGAVPPGAFRIWTREERSRELGEEHLLGSYEEWQEGDAGPRGRRSSVVFRRDASAPNGLVWLSVHETWIEGEGE